MGAIYYSYRTALIMLVFIVRTVEWDIFAIKLPTLSLVAEETYVVYLYCL